MKLETLTRSYWDNANPSGEQKWAVQRKVRQILKGIKSTNEAIITGKCQRKANVYKDQD